MLQLTENRQFIARYVGTVAVIAWATALVVGGLFDLREFWAEPWAEVCRRIWIGVRSLFLASVAAYFALTKLNGWLWRTRLVSALGVKIPDFSGRWEGWYRPTLTSRWRPTAHEISQRGLDISATAWGPTNVSRSISASIVTDSHGLLAQIVWAYRTEWTAGQPRGGDAHSGVHLLCLCDHDGASYLEGRYINDRERKDGSLGAVGEIRVKRVPTPLQRCLNFKETGWGLPRPPDDQNVQPPHEGGVKAAEVRKRLEKAVGLLNERDTYLLRNDLSERCITSRLAMYLQPLFPDHVVDVEYNRAGAIPKRLNLPDKCANFQEADGRSLVVPDIIVHRRGPEGPNLLVLELKKSTNREGPECDRRRVPAFVSQLGYACGALVACETKPDHNHVAAVTDWCEH